jgi:predicted ABC-type ATPase
MTFDADDYVLSPDVLRERFTTRILPQLTAAPSPSPTAIVLGAQPGAGKTVALDHLLRSHPEPVVALFADDFRAAHPAYESLMATQPQNMPAATSQASGAWLHMAIEHGIENRWNIAWETTFRSTDALAADVGTAAAAGYRVEVSALAVPRAESLLRTVERCINQGPAGRVVHVEDHDAPYHQAPKTLTRLSEIDNVQVRVLDTNLTQLYPGDYPSATDALRAGHTLPPGAAADLTQRAAAASRVLRDPERVAVAPTLRNSLTAVSRATRTPTPQPSTTHTPSPPPGSVRNFVFESSA